MKGGLLQIASSGVEDEFLTSKPEITFFRKKYKNYTNFSMETQEVTINDIPEYGDEISVTINNNGDLLHKCFIEVEIPNIVLTDSIITDINYIDEKNNLLLNTENSMNRWLSEYELLKDFSDIQILFYNKMKILIASDNIVFSYLKTELNLLKKTYNDIIEQTIFRIDEDLKDLVDIIGYVDGLNITFTEKDNLETNELSVLTFEENIDMYYNYNIEYLGYYYSNYIYHKKKYDKINTGIINYAWIKNLGNNYFTNYTTEIGGIIIEQYSNDYLNLYTSHHLNSDEKYNYDVLIGNVPEVNDLETEKENIKLYIPLQFWFNTNPSNAIPLVALKHTEVKISFKLNELKNLLYFEDYGKQYENLLVLEYPLEKHDITTSGFPKELSGLSGNINKTGYMKTEKMYIYYCNYITKNLLLYHYPNLNEDDLDYMLSNYSSDGTNITKVEWMKIRLAMKTDTNLESISKIINSYYHYLDFNYLRNQFGYPKLKFYADYILLDEFERNMFASGNLEYVIPLTNEFVNIVNNKDSLYYISELNLLRLIKNMYWCFKPILHINGLSDSDIKDPNIYNKVSYFDDDIITNMKLNFDGERFIDTDMYGFNLYEYTNHHKYLNNFDNTKFYYYSYALYPEDNFSLTSSGVYSGASNLSLIKNKNINFMLNSDFLTNYYDIDFNTEQLELYLIFITKRFNILNINKGKARLVFYQ